MSTITPNIIINAAEDIVNLPQSRNDTFNRRWNSAFGASPEVCSVLWNKIDPFKRTFRHRIQLKFRQLIRRGRRRFHDGSGGNDLAIRVEICQLCHPPGRDWRRTTGFDSWPCLRGISSSTPPPACHASRAWRRTMQHLTQRIR